MNRRIPIALALLTTLALAGCSAETPDEKFLRVIHENTEIELSDAELLTLGNDVCNALAMGGGSLILGLAFSSGLESEDYGFVTGVASETLCPEN